MRTSCINKIPLYCLSSFLDINMPINLPRSITSRFTTISYGQQQIILFKFMDLVKLWNTWNT